MTEAAPGPWPCAQPENQRVENPDGSESVTTSGCPAEKHCGPCHGLQTGQVCPMHKAAPELRDALAAFKAYVRDYGDRVVPDYVDEALEAAGGSDR